MEYQEELDDEVIYDEIMYPPSGRRVRSETDHYSQWGPKRPRHTIDYPKRRPSKFEAHRRCVCHQLSMTCIVFSILSALFAVAVLMIALSYYAKGYFSQPRSNNVIYGPGDTQSLYFSAIFCGTLSVSKDSLYPKGYQESGLYLLKEPPSLTGNEEVKFGVIISKPYKHNFHLFKGSIISVKACLESSDSYGIGRFYLVKGKSTWEDANGNINKSISVDSFSIQKACHHEGKSDIKSTAYTVLEEDQYYLYFVNGNTSAAVTINATLNIQRKLYNFSKSSIVKSCKFSTEPCSLKLPFQSSTSVLLTYGRPDSWEDSRSNWSINVSCQPRIWFYCILVAMGLLIIVAGTCAGCLACWCCTHSLYKMDETETPLLNAHTGNLYGDVPSTKEMRNPSKYRWNSNKEAAKSGEFPVSTSRKSQAPVDYEPPSFKDSSYGPGTPSYDTGTPSYDTFTKK